MAKILEGNQNTVTTIPNQSNEDGATTAPANQIGELPEWPDFGGFNSGVFTAQPVATPNTGSTTTSENATNNTNANILRSNSLEFSGFNS